MKFILTALRRFLYLLPFGNRDKRNRNRALQQLYTKFKSMDPSIYHPYTDLFESGLGNAFHHLFLGTRKLREMLENSIASESEDRKRSFFDRLVTARLETLKIEYRTFTTDGIKQRMQGSLDYGETLRILDGDFGTFLDVFNGPEFRGFNRSFDTMLQLVNVCRFDFVQLLKKFSKDFEPSGNKQNFERVSGAEIASDLLDFYFVVAGVRFSDDLTRNLLILAESLETTPEFLDGLKDDLREINHLLSTELNTENLRDYIRGIENDPFIEPEYEYSETRYLKVFCDRMRTRYRDARTQFLDDLKKTRLEAMLKKLFSQPLADIPDYADSTSAALRAKGLPGFTFVLPMRVLKSYILEHYTQSLDNRLARILTAGEFLLGSFSSDLSNTHHLCNLIQGSLNQFEATLASAGDVSIGKLQTALSDIENGTAGPETAEKAVAAINALAEKTLRDNTEILNRLNELLKVLLEDARMKQPTIVANIRIIDSGNSQRFLDAVAAARARLSLYLKIMENFIALRVRPRKDAAP